MTRKSLARWFIIVMCYLVMLIAIALYLSGGNKPDEHAYRVFKDLSPLFIAIPTAWLASVLQRRASFLSTLHALYNNVIASVQSAIQYTHKAEPSQADFVDIQKQLSITIELFRGSFRNLGEDNGTIGVYPFEALKTVKKWIDYAGFGENSTPDKRAVARRAIVGLWQNRIRKPLLNEFDRETPTSYDTPFWQTGDTSTAWEYPPKS
jgi:hypothetical protein